MATRAMTGDTTVVATAAADAWHRPGVVADRLAMIAEWARQVAGLSSCDGVR